MLSANDNMNMKELKAQLFSEICFMHETNVSEDPVVRKDNQYDLWIASLLKLFSVKKTTTKIQQKKRKYIKSK
jgi:hypothetical protein